MVSASKIELSELVLQTQQAVLAGTSAARGKQLTGLKATQKSDDKEDIVTAGDVASQSAILAKLLFSCPQNNEAIGVLAEEKIDTGAYAEDTNYRWVIDPIDGTLPYSKGEPFWCVSVA